MTSTALYQNPQLGFHTFSPANYPASYDLLRDKKVNVNYQGHVAPAAGSRSC